MNRFAQFLIRLIPSRTIRRKLREPSRPEYLHRLIAEIWSFGRVTPEWLGLLGLLSQSVSEWAELSGDVWLMYAAGLCETGEKEKAAHVLEKYSRRFGTRRIDLIFPLAAFADEIGIANPEITASANAFRTLEQNRRNGMLAETLRGQSVAVVGNGPSEIGTGHGNRIDAYDKVIRLNNYRTAGYETDYGSRTNIWVTSAGKDVRRDRSYTNYELIVIGPNLWHSFLSEEERALILEIHQKTDRIVTFDPPVQAELWEALGGCPSYGLVTIWTILRQNLTPLTSDDVFGFSFQQKVRQAYAEHYFRGESVARRKERSHAHNFLNESAFLEKLFRQNGE
ncbi:MAG: glycosyltransferase family 29 protein [Thermoguttaceae bacterium]|nr:glycosyltransferase family 29 protein [Thermoguttaceae bacterium]